MQVMHAENPEKDGRPLDDTEEVLPDELAASIQAEPNTEIALADLGESLESTEEVVFDRLVANMRADPPRMQPKLQANSLGESDAAYAHGPRAPSRVSDTLPNADPVVLNITQPLRVAPRTVEPKPPATQRPEPDERENATFRIPASGVSHLKRKVVTGAIVATIVLGVAALVRWQRVRVPVASAPPSAVAIPALAPNVAPAANGPTASTTSSPAVAQSPPVVRDVAPASPRASSVVQSSPASVPLAVSKPASSALRQPAPPLSVAAPPVGLTPPPVTTQATSPFSPPLPKDDVPRTF